MIIVTNTTIITKGEGYKLIDRFNKTGQIETMEGFLGLEVLFTENLKEHDEVIISTRWASKEAFKNWTKSDAFKQSHSHKGGKPEYIIENKISYYDVRVVRQPVVTA